MKATRWTPGHPAARDGGRHGHTQKAIGTGATAALLLAAIGIALSSSAARSETRHGDHAAPLAAAKLAPGQGAMTVVEVAVPPFDAATPAKRKRPSKPLGKASGLRWVLVKSSATGSSSATKPSATSTPAACTIDGCPPVVLPHLSRLFQRTTGDLEIRAFVGPVLRPPMFGPTSLPVSWSCGGADGLVLELSDTWAIGTVSVPGLGNAATASPGSEGITIGSFDEIESALVGVAEQDPIQVVAAHLDPAVSSVTATFANGATDSMAVDNGWVVLANDGSGPLPVELSAYSAAGTVLGTATVASSSAFAGPLQCLPPLPIEPLPARPLPARPLPVRPVPAR